MIYADYSASAPLSDEVKKYLLDRITHGPFANPNSSHKLGAAVLGKMEESRKRCAKVLRTSPNQIIFTSGSAEGIATIFHSCLENKSEKTIIISSIEHSTVSNTAKYYQSKGHTLKILPVSTQGIVDIKILKEWLKELKDQVALIAIMMANNETGIIQPIRDIVTLAKTYQIPVFSDTTQYIGKADFHFNDSGLDFAVLSGHKIGAMTGSGLILAKDPSCLHPIIFGGKQEAGLRGGTQNYLGYETIGIALKEFAKNLDQISVATSFRLNFERKIKNKYQNVFIIGEDSHRLPTTTLIAYKGIPGYLIQSELEEHDIYVTTASACSDNDQTVSTVLKAMNLPNDIAKSVIRISFGLKNLEQKYDTIFDALCETYEKLTNKKK